MKAQGEIYGDKLQKEIKKYPFSFCLGFIGEPICSGDSSDGANDLQDLLILPLQGTAKLTASTTDSAVHADIALLWLNALSSLKAQSVEKYNHITVFD